jgi:hypothetical protein
MSVHLRSKLIPLVGSYRGEDAAAKICQLQES